MAGTWSELGELLLRGGLLLFGGAVVVGGFIRFGAWYYHAAKRCWEEYLRAYREKQGKSRP